MGLVVICNDDWTRNGLRDNIVAIILDGEYDPANR